MTTRSRPHRVFVAVLHELLNAADFATLSDLTEAFKARLAQLRIPYNAGLVNIALDEVAKGARRPLLTAPPPAPLSPLVAPPVADPSPLDARRVLRAIADAQAAWTGAKTMPAAAGSEAAVVQAQLRDRFRRDRTKAAALVAQEILDTVARCEALERDEPK